MERLAKDGERKERNPEVILKEGLSTGDRDRRTVYDGCGWDHTCEIIKKLTL